MDEDESKKYSWDWVTASRLLSHGPCELIYARSMSAAAESNTFLYDGENTSGVPVIELEGGVLDGHEFAPARPVYCKSGLYVDIGTNTIGVFVQWRGLPE